MKLNMKIILPFLLMPSSIADHGNEIVANEQLLRVNTENLKFLQKETNPYGT